MRTFLKKISRHVIAISLLLSLVLPQVANAQLLTNDPILTGQIIMEYIGKVLKVAMKNVVVVGAVQLSQKVARDAAESVATWMWEGNPGKSPLTYMESPGDFIKKQGDRAVSDLLDQMSADVANANLLCVSDPTAALGVLAGLYSALKDKANVKPFGYQPGSTEFSATPDLNLGKCDAGSIALNYQSLTNELSSDELLKRFSNAATSGGSEVDQIVAAQFDAMNSLIRGQKAAELERLNTKSHRDQTSLISGEITLPSASVAEESKTNTAKFQQEQENQQLAGILSSGAEAIPSIFATTFANAISKKIIEKLKRGKGTNPFTAGSVNLSNVFGSGKSAGNSTPGSLYSDTKTVTISEGELDLLSSFTACPDKFYGTDNCVIDEGFAAAIRTADAGKPLTVKEALEQDKLHANFEMVPPAKSALNESRLCSKSAYCFSNLAKLRKARVIPIGWEIAAAAADGTGKVTLGEVVKGFNQCSYTCSNDAKKACTTDAQCAPGGTCTVPTRTKENPYCHLIDPNWVLKMPEQICRAKVYGPQLQSSMGADRQEVCSDQASCLQEDSNGQCTGAFGYCLREKNTFRFEADECPAQFAGCRTYGNKEFGNISLVDATIEAGSCTDKNSGCLGYVADYLPTGLFDESSTRVYLNGKAASCGLENIGCTEVTNSANNKQQFLRLPPASLGCKGYSNDVSACKQYAQACTVDEVGCEVYQPIGSGDAAVPGVITVATRDTSGNVLAWNDECSSECVGYSSYYQAPTPIEPIQKVATAFMPQTATMCTQQVVGCDAYINVDTAAKGAGQTAFFAQPQKCSDPAIDENHAIYYSWEGSDQSGYQLRQHDLVNDGVHPKYDVPAAELSATDKKCTADIYKTRIIAEGVPNPAFNTDCRELFDKAGAPSYRLLSKTIPSTPNCVAFRKETATQDNCVASNGVFDKTTGSCTYGFLPSASTQCKVEEVGCRAYAGAAALSPKVVLNEEFITLEGWSGGESSNEGITVGDSVLKMTASTASHSITLTQGKTYNVVFWAKGQGKVSVSFGSGKNGATSVALSKEPIAVNSDWRRFEVSSAPLPWSDSETAKIVFTRENGNIIYLENILVKEQADMVYAVKDSWVTPLSCDATPSDDIPGQALNCRSYKPKSQVNSQPVFLTGFTNLCRAQSAGCQKFVTTQNTAQVYSEVVNFGENSEKVEQIRTIPGDDFVYVIANSAASCPADKKGCSALGLKLDGKAIQMVAKINNPSDYDSTTCKVADEWCQTFTTPGGTSRYFKFPDTGKQCEYREKAETNGVAYSGWFKKGTTMPCYESFVTGGNNYGIYKNKDNNFTGMVGVCAPEYNQCTEFIDHADVSRENPSGRAYYFMNNSRLDQTTCSGKVSLKDGCVLLENTDAIADTVHSTLATYCKSDPTISSSCKQILAAAKVAVTDQGKDGVTVAPVQGLKNADYSSCRAAEINGLFVATDCDSQLAKLKTAGKAGVLACPTNAADVQKAVDAFKVVCAPLADSNTIVKVRRDRTCAEWLSCQSSLSVFDKSTQKFKDVCTALGVCNKLSNDSGAVGQCANWVTPSQMKDDEKIQRALPLTTSRYISRNVGWYGHEFSGYSLWKKFQPDTVGQFSDSSSNDAAMKVGVGFTTTSGCKANTDIGVACTATVFTSQQVKDQITNEFGAVSFEGQCFEQKCWYPIDGFKTETVDYTKSTCRGYPEVDSPFPQSVVEGSNLFGVAEETAQGYKNANICEKYLVEKPMRTNENWSTFDAYKTSQGRPSPFILALENGSCECSYKKIVYGQMNEERYYALANIDLDRAIGKAVVVRVNGKWFEGTVSKFDSKIYKVVDKYNVNTTYTISSSNDIAFIDGDKTKLIPGKLVVALNKNGEWYDAKIIKGGAQMNTDVQFLNGKLDDATIKDLLAKLPGFTVSTQIPFSDLITESQKKFPTLIYSLDSINIHAGKISMALITRNEAIAKISSKIGTDLTDKIKTNSLSGKDLNTAVYNYVMKNTPNSGGTIAWENFVQAPLATIESKTNTIIENSVAAQGKIQSLGATSATAGTIVVDTFKGLAILGDIQTNSSAPQGICGGGWFVIGDKTAPSPKSVSKSGLSCTTDFDCIDERVITMKDPQAQGADKSKNEEGYVYQYSNDDGKCEFKKKETKVYGWEGYCLEKDLSTYINNNSQERGCLTWLPLDVVGSDIYNQYKSAGYSIDPDGSGKYYCEENRGRLGNTVKDAYSYNIGYLEYFVSGSKDKGFLDSVINLISPVAEVADGVIGKNTTPVNSSLDQSKSFRGYKSYGNTVASSLPDLYASEIDYIELVAEKNKYFPDGYTMKIRNDGRATIYQYTPTIEAWKSSKPAIYKDMQCPAWTANNDGQQGYDYFNGDYLAAPITGQFEQLQSLSFMVRCKNASDKDCDYYGKEKDIKQYFSCKGSEDKDVVYPDVSAESELPRPMAITGVMRSAFDNKGNLYSNQLFNGELSQIWFVRIDNQKYRWYSGKHHIEFGRQTFQLGDIISKQGDNIVPIGSNHKYCQPENYTNDKKGSDNVDLLTTTGEQQGYELRFMFDKNGKYSGIDSGTCTQREDATIYVGWKVKIHVRDACTQIAQTVDNEGKNAAFTHRLWTTHPAGYAKAEDSEDVTAQAVKVVKNSSVHGLVPSMQKYGSFAVQLTPNDLWYTYAEDVEKTAPGFKNNLVASNESKGYSCPTGKNCLKNDKGNVVGNIPLNNGQDALKKLFGKYFAKFTAILGSGTVKYNAGLGSDNTETGAKTPPVIFALDPSTCGGIRGGTCTMTKKYGMTINGVYDDNATVFGKGSVAATMQFYGYADQNQMPLKRLTIDWNDKSAILQKSGEYRNHKPVCSTQQAPVAVCKSDATQSAKYDFNHVCVTNKDCASMGESAVCANEKSDLRWAFGSWGGNGSTDEGACEPGFFQFTHAYTFTPDCGSGGAIKATTAASSDIAQYKLEGKVGIGERFCVFKPRVQLLDNWGACNGTPSGVGGKDELKNNKCDAVGDVFKAISTPFQGNIIVKE